MPLFSTCHNYRADSGKGTMEKIKKLLKLVGLILILNLAQIIIGFNNFLLQVFFISY